MGPDPEAFCGFAFPMAGLVLPVSQKEVDDSQEEQAAEPQNMAKHDKHSTCQV
jgi:hypothetical protein